jgi:uncharacterized damage-inducible protein DinB
MDPHKTYEYLILARQRVFDWVRPLSAAQYTQDFQIGPGSLAKTLTHMLISEWYYILRITESVVPPQSDWPIRDENPPAFADLEAAWKNQAERTRAAITAVRDWATELSYEVTDDSGKRLRIGASRADVFTQLILHEVHHRAQVMNMLKRLGVAAEDLDFNALMYKRQPIPGDQKNDVA